MESVIQKNQKKTFSKNITYCNIPARIICTIRYDDDCGNGHNSFSITGEIINPAKNRNHPDFFLAGGCIHDEIEKHFPELKHFIRFHHFNSDAPMYYIENTLYHAGNLDCYGKAKGEPSNYDDFIYFNDFPIGFPLKKDMRRIIEDEKLSPETLEIIAIPHKEKSTYGEKFSFKGYAETWYNAQFDTFIQANEWKTALICNTFTIKKIPTDFSEGKERDFPAARACAAWPDAPEDILSLPRDELKTILLNRLPALMNEFKNAISELNFIY